MIECTLAVELVLSSTHLNMAVWHPFRWPCQSQHCKCTYWVCPLLRCCWWDRRHTLPRKGERIHWPHRLHKAMCVIHFSLTVVDLGTMHSHYTKWHPDCTALYMLLRCSIIAPLPTAGIWTSASPISPRLIFCMLSWQCWKDERVKLWHNHRTTHG